MKHIALIPARDRRAEDPTNIWLIDPIARRLVPLAVRLRISANAISISGLFVGAGAALAYNKWQHPGMAVLGFLITLVWLVMDSLDGMVARATNTTSAFGRELDGLCDHGVFTLIYIGLAVSIGGTAVWILAFAAGFSHALQASLYEAERDRFNRRMSGGMLGVRETTSRNPAARLYDYVASRFEGASAPFDQYLADAPRQNALRRRYGNAAAPALGLMLPLSQNMRLVVIFLACAGSRMTDFLWFVLIPLTALTLIGVVWHRTVEIRLLRAAGAPLSAAA